MSSKGTGVVLAGSIYPRKRKLATKKRKLASASGPRKRPRMSYVTGSGDYSIHDDSGAMIRTPFAHAGRDVGKFFFGQRGGDIGFAAGHLLGRIIGSGDYSHLKYNVLVNSTTVPEFASSKQTHIVTHREYIQDITTSSVAGAFKNESFPINPAQLTTFPWLSSIAEGYEQYRVHGMVFEFVTTSADALNSTNTALGTVIMATDYNSAAAPYTNKQAMENSQYANSAKPSVNQMHGIECASAYTPVAQLFTRSGALPSGQDLRWYDLGNFQIATTGFQGTNVTVGELWCTYVIEFFKPQIPQTLGGGTLSAHRYATSASSANPFGTAQIINNGSLQITTSGTSLTLKNVPPQVQFAVQLVWLQASGTVTAATGTTTVSNGQLLSYYAADTQSVIGTGFVPSSSAQQLNFFVQSTSTVRSDVTITLAGWTISPGCDIFVVQMDSTVVA